MNFLLKIIAIYFNTLSRINPELSAKQIFNFFAYPFSSKLSAEQQLYLNQSKMFQLSVEGKNIQCYTWGNGQEKILFVHGWQSNSFRWKSYIDALDRNRYTIYAFDAPGHGNSQGKICTIPLYEKCIQALIEKEGFIEHFVGHSIGSFACASFMYHHNYNAETYVSLASPFNALEFVDNFKNKIALSKRSLTYLSEQFKSYTTHPLEHYSQAVFSTTINPKKILIIHDKEDEATPYQNTHKTYQLLKKNNRNVELVLTDGYKHSLRSFKVVAMVRYCLEQQLEFES